MARRGMIAAFLLALVVVAGGLVVMTEGARLLLFARVLLWYGPDNAARAWEAYMRPHALRGLITMGSDHRLEGWPQVRWLLWKDRLAALREPLWRRKEMAWALGLGGGALLLALLRLLGGVLGWLWFLLRGVGRLTAGTTAGSARWATPGGGATGLRAARGPAATRGHPAAGAVLHRRARGARSGPARPGPVGQAAVPQRPGPGRPWRG